MTIKETYVAFDGTEFSDSDECQRYENAIWPNVRRQFDNMSVAQLLSSLSLQFSKQLQDILKQHLESRQR